MEEKRREDQSEELDSSTLQENSQETPPVRKLKILSRYLRVVSRLMLGCSLQAAEAKSVPTESFSSLLPKALSAVLRPGPSSDPQPSRDQSRRTPLNLQQLQTELRDLRDQFDQMKSQHKYVFVTVVTVKIFSWWFDVPILHVFNSSSVCCNNVRVILLLPVSKEIKLLMNELDEEKRIRLTLQVRHNRTKEIQLVRQLEYNRCNQPDLQLIFFQLIFCFHL